MPSLYLGPSTPRIPLDDATPYYVAYDPFARQAVGARRTNYMAAVMDAVHIGPTAVVSAAVAGCGYYDECILWYGRAS
jgi:hypothetical protein